MVTYESILDALGDDTRREILDRLRLRPMSVGEIASAFPISRPAISQHLKILKDASLVTDRAEGIHRVYALNPNGFALLRTWVDRFWTGAHEAAAAEPEAADDSWRNW